MSMNTFIKTLLFSISSIVLYLWLATTLNSCSGKKSANQTEVITVEKSTDDFEEFFEDEESQTGEIIDLSEDNTFDDNNSKSNYTAEDKEIYIEEAPVKEVKTKSTTTTTQSYTSTSGSYSSKTYMVIAGNYQQAYNADKMVSKLRNMGYPEAEKVIFDGSYYQTVIAARSNSLSDANSISSRLKNNGIDNYVKRKKG